MSRFLPKEEYKSGSSSEYSSTSEEDEEDVKAASLKPQASKRTKFLKGAASSDDSASSDDKMSSSDGMSDDDNNNTTSKQSFSKKTRKIKKFLKNEAASDDEDSDEDGVKVVKSARDKRFEEVRLLAKTLHNGKKIGDWISVQNEFDKLVKAQAKTENSYQSSAATTPRFYIRTLVQLEDAVKSASSEAKDSKRKMNALNAKALSIIKQKLKKYCKNLEAQMEAFRENPVEEDDSYSEAEIGAASEEEVEPAKPDPSQSTKTVEIADSEEKDSDAFIVVGKSGKNLEMTLESLFKRLKELVDLRGKKSTDRLGMIEKLRHLLVNARTPYQNSRVLLALIPAEFDYTSTSLGYMSIDLWKSQMMEIVELNSNIIVKDGVEEPENDAELDKSALAGYNVELLGNLGSFVDRLDEEFKKSLQSIDPHTTEFIDRLKDEAFLYTLIVRSQAYYLSNKKANDIGYAMVLMRRVEHIYFKPENVVKKVEQGVRQSAPKFAHLVSSENPVVALCVELFKTSDDRIRTRALLCNVYHLALHNKFFEARDMLLMSHLQETIQQTDVDTQILYNRAMVQLGICAFKQGMIKEAANALQDISASGRIKELLAQGVSSTRFGASSEKTAEQENIEKQRQMPFHMHINLELLECIYLTCSMLLEIPNMAMNSHDSRRKVISKPFRRMLDYNERQIFIGPPENTRDHIMGAAKAMASGDWRSARDLISTIKIWDLMPNAVGIKDMLQKKIQEESLRTYFITFSRYCDRLSLKTLAGRFEMQASSVKSVISKMILNEELEATLVQDSDMVVMLRKSTDEMSRLEYLTGVFAEKVAVLVDGNEKLLEASKSAKPNGR